MNDQLQRVFNVIRGDVFIGGGAAVDADLAQDIDVFFLDADEWEDAVDALLTSPLDHEVCYDGMSLAECLIDGVDKPVSLIHHERCSTVEELLAQFDVSTHQVALLRDDRHVMGPQWTSVDLPPRITRTTGGDSTRDRYARICVRYGHPIDADELATVPPTARTTER